MSANGIDWTARARREAAAILAEALGLPPTAPENYERLISFVAIGWLQGVNYGTHETLHAVEDTFEELRAAL